MANTRDVARPNLYRGPINLWVEDDVTRTYLAEVWADLRRFPYRRRQRRRIRGVN